MAATKRVLISEGSSLSARQTITSLGIAGHKIGVIDSNSFCLGRFSRFVTSFYRGPALENDPWGYLEFVVEVVRKGSWDVLFPTHEQAFLFARERARIPDGIGLAVSDFRSFLQVQGKVALAQTLARLEIPQPDWRVVKTVEELERESRFPFYLKGDYGTASRSVWRIRDREGLRSRIVQLGLQNRFQSGETFVAQQAVEGPLERVLAVFDRGRLVAMHGYRQMAAGPGGGDTRKVTVRRSEARRYMELLGADLGWHGALSMDYILARSGEGPLFIDANPRLVEPMNATLSGVNLADILVRLSAEEPVATETEPAGEIRSHMLLMALLSAATGRWKRIAVIRELLRVIAGRDCYADSREELLPLGLDFPCVIPLAYALIRLVAAPASAEALSTGAIASYSFSPAAARQIAMPNEERTGQSARGGPSAF